MSKRVFTGVFIPAKIWLNSELTVTEKFILAEITCLSDDERGCFANNRHFSDALGCTATSASNHISRLIEKGFLSVSYKDEKTHSGRVLSICSEKYYPTQNMNAPTQEMKGGTQNVKGGTQNVNHKYNLNTKGNTIQINNSTRAQKIADALALIEKENNHPSSGPVPQILMPEVVAEFEAQLSETQLEKWLSLIESDFRVKEGFTITQKIPSAFFDDYKTRFTALARTQEDKYQRRSDVTGHFLNWSRIEYQREAETQKKQKPANGEYNELGVRRMAGGINDFR